MKPEDTRIPQRARCLQPDPSHGREISGWVQDMVPSALVGKEDEVEQPGCSELRVVALGQSSASSQHSLYFPTLSGHPRDLEALQSVFLHKRHQASSCAVSCEQRRNCISVNHISRVPVWLQIKVGNKKSAGDLEGGMEEWATVSPRSGAAAAHTRRHTCCHSLCWPTSRHCC